MWVKVAYIIFKFFQIVPTACLVMFTTSLFDYLLMSRKNGRPCRVALDNTHAHTPTPAPKGKQQKQKAPRYTVDLRVTRSLRAHYRVHPIVQVPTVVFSGPGAYFRLEDSLPAASCRMIFARPSTLVKGPAASHRASCPAST